jgi:hypothetical protein
MSAPQFQEEMMTVSTGHSSIFTAKPAGVLGRPVDQLPHDLDKTAQLAERGES